MRRGIARHTSCGSAIRIQLLRHSVNNNSGCPTPQFCVDNREKKEGTQGDETEPPPFRARFYALILAFIVVVSIAEVHRPVDRLKE